MTVPEDGQRLAVVTDIMAPYRIPLLNAVAETLGDRFRAFFMGDRTDNRLWEPVTAEARFEYQIVPGRDVSPDSFLGFNRFWNPGMYKALDQFDPDVIVVGGYHHPTSYAVLAFARMKRRKLVLWSESTAMDLRPRSLVRTLVKKWFLSQTDYFIVPGNASEEYLVSLGVDRRRIVRSPNSVDVDRIEREANDSRSQVERESFRRIHGLPEKLLIFVGRLSPEKGFPMIVEIAERLQSTGRDVGLVVIGDGPRRAEYEQLTARLRRGSARFFGFVQPRDISAYYANADVLVVPSVSEPWGFVVNEGLACGVPVVCSSRVGAAYDLITHGETGFVCDDLDSYVKSVALLLDDAREAERVGRNGLARAKEFTPQVASAGFVALVTGGSKRRG